MPPRRAFSFAPDMLNRSSDALRTTMRHRDPDPPDPDLPDLDLPDPDLPDLDLPDLDLRGLKCPLPVLRTAKALRGLAPGAVLSVRCTDPMAAIDIPNLLRERGDHLERMRRDEGVLTFEIRRGATPDENQESAA